VFFSILHRMILWELVKVFTLSLVAITGIMLLGGAVAEATQQGLGPMQVIAIVPLLIPSTLPWTIPATTLFATCLVYGRLSADNEILAIKSAGVNILKVVWPAVLLGVVVSAATMGLYYRIIPYTHDLMRNLFLSDAQEVMYALLKKDKSISDPRLDFAVFVRQVQGRKLIDAVFKRRNKDGHFDLVIRAQEAELDVDLKNSVLLVHMRHAEIWGEDGTQASFPERIESVKLPTIFGGGRPPRPRDMTWKQMVAERRRLLERIGSVDDEARQTEENIAAGRAAPDAPVHVKNLKVMRTALCGEVAQIDTEFQMRPALSFGCLCFVLIGCPVGIWFSRGDYLSAFVTCFLPIIFVYYPLMLCGTNIAKDGKLHPALAVWAADALVALVGLLLYWRLSKN
jgi:lipopolysaccharide export system permease protein